jgi:hypothetical protein
MLSTGAARDSLRASIGAEAAQPIGEAAAALVAAILRRHGSSAAAVLFYGSCLRRGDPTASEDPVYDFYLLVDDYRRAYEGRLAALANALLPPNVFYLETPWRGRSLRAKYAILSLPQFRRAVSTRAFHSYFWARFAQPVRLAYVRDDGARADVAGALADAVTTLAARACGLADERFTAAELWTRAFQATYAAELRAEGADRARLVYEADRGRYDGLTEAALQAAGVEVGTTADGKYYIPDAARGRGGARSAWWLRRVLGKPLSILRLAKGVFTFDGGVDYILWKIERHSGVKATATPWQRRHPLLAAPSLAWRLYRLGAFR